MTKSIGKGAHKTIRWAAVFMVLTVTAASLLQAANIKPASADTGGYAWWNAPCTWNGSTTGPCSQYAWGESTCPSGDGYCTPTNLVNGYYQYDQWGEQFRNCTSYAAWMLSTANGFTMPYYDLAKNWGSRASALGYTVNNVPAIGSIYYTTGGTFGHVAWVQNVPDSTHVTIEDYNSDTTGDYSGLYTVLTSSATGYIHFKDMSGGGGGSIYGPAHSDVDHNGMSDLVLTTQQSTGSGNFAMLGTGNGFLAPASWLDMSGYGWSGVTPLVGHENGSTSYADYIFITNEGSNGIKVFTAYSNGSNGFSAPVLKQTIPGIMYSDIKASIGDVDHNGIADIILTVNESTGTGVYVMAGTGNGFLAPTKWLDLSGYGWSGVTPLVGHENGNTSYDDYVFITNEGANGIKVFDALSNGSSGFSAPVLKLTLPGLMYAGIKASMGDVDFNGIADIILTTDESTGTGVYVMAGTGNGFLSPAGWLDLSGYGWSGVTPLVGHENGNTSYADYIFITDEGANGIKVFTAYSNGSSGFATPVLKQTITTMTYSGVKAYLK